MQYLLFIQYVSRKGDPFMRLSLVLCWVFFYLCFGVSQLTEVIAETIGMGGGGEVMKSMHILSLDHFSSVIFRHDIVYLQLQGRIVNSLYHISRLKLISPIVSHGQGDGPYQMPRSCQYAILSPGAS